MESKWRLLLPLLLGSAMAQDPAITSSAPLPAITNMPFAIDSMLNCLIEPDCTMAAFSSGTAPAPVPHSTFVSTTTISGNPVTVEVASATPGGLDVRVHDAHSAVKCHAPDGTADSFTCDQLVDTAHHHHRVKLVDPEKNDYKLLIAALAVVGSLLAALLLGICLCCLCAHGGRSRSRRTPTDMPGEHSVTEITKTTTTSSAGTLGRAAEEGRSVAPFGAGAGAGAAAAESAENVGQGAGGVGAESAAQGAQAGQAMGQGAEAAGAGVGSGTAAAGQGVGQGLGGAAATSVDQTGSEVVDTGSMRGRRTLRGGNQQVIA